MRRQVPSPYEDTTCQMVVAYGAHHHPHLDTMRRFRDEILKPNRVGARLVEGYYRVSPFVADRLKRRNGLRTLMKYAVGYPSYLVSRFVLQHHS